MDIVYERLHMFCHQCQVIGHDACDCRKGQHHDGHDKLMKQHRELVRQPSNPSQEPPLKGIRHYHSRRVSVFQRPRTGRGVLPLKRIERRRMIERY